MGLGRRLVGHLPVMRLSFQVLLSRCLGQCQTRFLGLEHPTSAVPSGIPQPLTRQTQLGLVTTQDADTTRFVQWRCRRIQFYPAAARWLVLV